MRRLSDTITRLNAAAAMMTRADAGTDAAGLRALAAFGSNPGALDGWFHVPDRPAHEAVDMPLVVVLHGCTQTAAGYDRGSGWSDLADRFGFALLFPEQRRANNANACFNWFQPDDVRRDGGEALSIRQMVSAMVDRQAIDPARIFITGLSAGGAMTSAMLASYPELFAGGAIIAGLPHAAAASMPQAFDRMRGHGHPDDHAYAGAIRAASPHRGPWPAVGVWHGDADATVDAVNADRIVGQWRALQGLADRPDRQETIEGCRHRIWHAPDGGVRLEEYRIAGMGHGTPLRTDGDTACGAPMPYMLDAGISSTWHIARQWGLLGERRPARSRPRPDARPAAAVPPAAASRQPPQQTAGIQATIKAALRSAGLLR